jgi:diguanylate cyclase (GGDEF)-like protein
MKPDKVHQPFNPPKECKGLTALFKKSVQDLTEEDLQIRDYLFRDTLTGLPNRTKLIRDVEINRSPVLFLINIDRFNQINNLFGAERGDAVLIALAEKLSEHLHKYPSTLYKFQADEYAVLMNISDTEIPWEMIEQIAAHLISSVERDLIHVHSEEVQNGYEVALNITIGISVAEMVGKENLLTSADMALKTAKNLKKPFLFYKQSEDTRKKYEKNIYWAKIIKDAIREDRVVPYYQPIFNNHTGRDKYEALVRLMDTEGVPSPPDDFIELSKVIRMYSAITRVMIKKSFNAITDSPYELSVNLSVQDILDPDLRKFIVEMIERHDIGRKLTFELLESEEIENYKEVAAFVAQFKEMGCKLSIDDFGTGYSNFAHLIRLRVDFLKIDASLIKDIVNDRSSQILVKSVVSFAREMGIKTIAEFVHSKHVLELITVMGVDFAQGYYIGKPQPSI